MRSYDISQYAELTKWLGAGVQKALKRAALGTAARLVSTIQGEIIPNENPPPVDRNFYRAAWQFQPTDRGADVWNSMPYAGVIDQGARAENIKIGRAMIQALKEWILRKGFVRPQGRGKGAQASAEQAAERMAWAVAVKMQQRGIFNRNGLQGLHIMDKAQAKTEPILLEEFKREIRRELSE